MEYLADGSGEQSRNLGCFWLCDATGGPDMETSSYHAVWCWNAGQDGRSCMDTLPNPPLGLLAGPSIAVQKDSLARQRMSLGQTFYG
jgi:hypothetical protein